MLLSDVKLFQGFDISIPNTLVYVIIGIVGVFLVLAVLIGLLYLFQMIFKFNVLDKIASLFKKKEKASAAEEENAVSGSADTVDENELIAVISAAISAVYESESGEVPPFVIRNIKRK